MNIFAINSTIQFASRSDTTVTNGVYNADDSVRDLRGGFGAVNRIWPGRQLQLVTRITFGSTFVFPGGRRPQGRRPPTSARLPRCSRAFRRYEPEADDENMHEGARVGPGSEIPMPDCRMTRGVAPGRRGGLPSGSAKLSHSYPVLTRPEGSDPCRGES